MNPSAVMSYLCSRQWAMDPQRLQAIADQVAAGIEAASPAALQATKDESSAGAAGPGYDVVDGVAHIKIEGPILKDVPCVMRWLGMQATSARTASAAIEAAVEDDKVKAIALDIDSPGGALDGAQDLADTVFAVRGLKPITAHASGMMASAALWIGSQADKVTAGESTLVGSIGVFRVYEDTSEAAAKCGVRVQVISSHELKGAGVPGTQLTEAQRADAQRIVDEATGIFVSAVARGRNLSPEAVREIATGQVWFAGEAMARGLVDGVATNKTAHAAVMPGGRSRAETNAPRAGAQEETEMADTKPTNPAQADAADFEKLKAENERTKAEAAALKASLDALNALQREQVIEKYRDRVGPANLESVRKLGVTYAADVAGFETFVKGLPVITRAERESAAGVEGTVDVKPATEQISDAVGARALAKCFGQSDARLQDMVAIGDAVERVEFDQRADDNGKVTMVPMAVMKDGSRIERSALRKSLGLKGALAGLLFALFASNAHAAALSGARATECKSFGAVSKAYLMKASTTIYAGGLVMVDTNGVALPAAASASNHGVVGVAQETKTSAASGSYWVGVTEHALCKFAATSIAQGNVGQLVYAEDDQTVDETPSANEPIAGILLQYASASSGWVLVGSEFTIRDAVAADPLTLTGDLTCSGGAGALTFTDSASSVVLPDNDTTALLIGSTGQLGLVTIDTGDGTETVQINGTVGQQSFHVDEGTVTFDETLTVGSSIALSDGLTIDQSANNILTIAENSEDLEVTFASNKVTTSSTTGVTTWDFGSVYPIVSGTTAIWSIQAGANTACNTTCTHACVFGFDDGAADAETIVACDDAAADKCLCAGPN